jgi:arginase family enzyme
LNPSILLKLFENFADKIIGIDIVEVIPDPSRITQILAAKIIMEFIAAKSV